LLSAHCASAAVSGACLALHRVRHAALALGIVAAVDLVLLADTASWQVESVLAFLGPVACLVSVALTVGASLHLSAAIAAPLLAIAAASVARGVQLGAEGIAWSLVAANAYAAAVGAIALKLGARRVDRFSAVTSGMLVASCAPAVAGWTYRALGDSVRAASVVDLLFLIAIVVTSAARWIRLCHKSSSQRSQARSLGH
jgi:hypothetical protein